MNTTKLQVIARAGAVIATVVIVVCVGILLRDYLVARALTPRDDQRIRALQEQVKTDASLAPKLAAEEKAITARRLARKARDNRVADVLIAAAALFLLCSKWLLGLRGRPAVAMSKLVQIAVAQAASPGVPGSTPAERQAGKPPPPPLPGVDLQFVNEIVAKEARGKEAAILLLQAIQAHYRYLPDEALRRLCELTDITPAQVAGASSFYAQFRRSPVGEHIVRVCHGTACHVAGARQITDELRRYLAIPDGADTDPGRMFTVDEVACLGCCSLAPVLMVDGQTAGRLTPAGACDALKPFEPEPSHRSGSREATA